MLEALIAGTESPEMIAELARGALRRKRVQLVTALEGVVGPSQRMLLASHLRNLDFMTAEIDRLSTEIADRLRPYHELVERLDTIPGVGEGVAQASLAEIGTDVSRFPTGSHLASRARVCPSNDESAGKRRTSHIGPGNPWCERHSSTLPGPRHMPRTRTWLRSTAALPPGEDTNAHSSPWRTPFCSSPTGSSAMAASMRTSAATILTGAIAARHSAAPFSVSSGSAARSLSPKPPNTTPRADFRGNQKSTGVRPRGDRNATILAH